MRVPGEQRVFDPDGQLGAGSPDVAFDRILDLIDGCPDEDARVVLDGVEYFGLRIHGQRQGEWGTGRLSVGVPTVEQQLIWIGRRKRGESLGCYPPL
ncbi:hypothetical protein DXT87_12180 [Arthrobacter sp. AET 35A]|nr:hypothetical protein [Arthrobacter sp. AET 35A]